MFKFKDKHKRNDSQKFLKTIAIAFDKDRDENILFKARLEGVRNYSALKPCSEDKVTHRNVNSGKTQIFIDQSAELLLERKNTSRTP